MAISREAEISISAASMFPGFRFSPTDEELILFYLRRKVEGCDKSVEIINEVDICKHEPWDLPAKSVIRSTNEWFFFSPRGKKYPNGSQSKRATEIGYWKATGKERDVRSGSEVIGTKRTLVFHIGRAPKGERTEWIMHEYCMTGRAQDSLVICRLRRKSDFHTEGSGSWDILGSNPSPCLDNRIVDGPSGSDQNGISAGGDQRALENWSRMGSSSNDSHSFEQNNHTSNSSTLKPKDESTDPVSSIQQTHLVTNNEDDCFADILKDNIVDLDESSLPHVPGQIVTIKPIENERGAHRGAAQEPFASGSYPSQGTANRRIRLKKLRHAKKNLEESSSQSSSNQPTELTVRKWRKVNKLHVVIVFVTAVVLFLSGLSGMSWQANNRSTSACFCATLWLVFAFSVFVCIIRV